MATSALDLTQQTQVIPPQIPASQEHTTDAPMQGTAQDPPNNGNISEEDQQSLIALVRSYKDQWSQDRQILIERCLENLEFFKGNQNIVFGSGTTGLINTQSWIDSVSGSGKQHAENADDDDLFQDCLNFYQMLGIGFVASLCPELPKSKWMPGDADDENDVTITKVAQFLIDKVERDNKEASLLKSQLLFLFCTGSAYRFTRFVVSSDYGTKPEPIYSSTETEIMPDRMHCFACGKDSSPDAMGPMAQGKACPGCGQSMGDDSFFPAVRGPITKQIGTAEVPNGIVAQNIYNALDVDGDPRADGIKQTPILNLDQEVHLGALRTAYPGMYKQIEASAVSELSTNGSMDRLARQQLYSQTEGQSSILSDMRPTLSQTWIQPWAFAINDDEAFVKRMTTAFPDGCLLINTGATFLSCTPMDMNKHWTWCGTHEGFGLNPPAPGDVIVPFQRRYNDMGNLLHDGVARCFAGVTLANNDLIDSKSFEGKKLQFGSLNGVKLKRTGAPGSQRLSDALHQFEFNLKIAEGMAYQKELAFSAQMFAHVPPQVYGGQGDPNIQTKGGQEQQLNTALGALNIYWENIKDEHAQADELAVLCAKDNLTSDMKYAIEDKGAEFRNQLIRMDDLQGNLHAYSDEDQGLPVTAAELRDRWMTLLTAADKNPYIQAIFEDPENQEQAAGSIGVPDMVVPGAAMRNKVLTIIAQLIEAQPVPSLDPTGQPMVDPQTGQPQMEPSIMPDQDIDDFDILRQVVREYCQKNNDLAVKKPQGFQNCLLYLRAGVKMQTAMKVQDAQSQGQAEGTLKGTALKTAAPPPQPPPQLDPEEKSFVNALRAAAIPIIDDGIRIAATPALPKGSSLQAQAAMTNNLLNFIAKTEQTVADKTAPQG